MYKLYARPHIDFGHVIYHDQSMPLSRKLESTQYKAALAVSGARKGTNKDRLLEELGWETLSNRRWYRRLCLFYKIVNNQAPHYLRDYIPEENNIQYILSLLRENISRTLRFSTTFIPFCSYPFIPCCKNSIDDKGLAGALLMDLSKAFDSVNHDLLIAKSNAYGLNMDALKLIKSYLSKRHQRVKMNSSFSVFPQGLVLGPLLFNVFMNDIFLFVRYSNICNYADDTTISACHPILETVVRQLETDGTVVAKWFSNNYLKLNDDKCHLMIFGEKCSRATVTIGNSTIDHFDN